MRISDWSSDVCSSDLIISVIFRKTLAAGRKETNTLIFRCLAGTVLLGIEISVLLFYCRNHNGNRWLLTSRIFGLPDDAAQSLLALWANERDRKSVVEGKCV